MKYKKGDYVLVLKDIIGMPRGVVIEKKGSIFKLGEKIEDTNDYKLISVYPREYNAGRRLRGGIILPNDELRILTKKEIALIKLKQ